MKKSSLALGAVAVLVATWAGGTWYSGKILEEKYPEYVQQANEETFKQLVGYEYQFEVKNTKLARSFFSTEIEDQLIITHRTNNKQYIIPFKTIAEHGPLPLSRLTSLRLAPVMTSAHSEIIEDPSITELFKASKGVAPLSSDFTISYNQQITQHSTFAALDYQNDDFSIDSSEINIEADTNQKGVGLIKAKMDKLNVTDLVQDFDRNYQKIYLKRTIQAENIDLNSDLKPSEWEFIPSGKQLFSIDNIKITEQSVKDSSESKMIADLRALRFNYATKLNGEFADISLNNQLNEVYIGGEALGKIEFNIDLNHLKAEPLNQIMEIYSQGQIVNQHQLEQQLAAPGLALLQNQPEIRLQPFSLTNNKGENKLTLDLGLSKADPSATLMQGKILSLFDKLELNADISKPAVEQFLTSMVNIEINNDPSVPEYQAEQLEYLKADMEQQFADAIQQKILVTSDNQAYQSKLILENGELKLNGEVIPEENIAQALMMLFMGGF
ncbi:YdgA family protein [Testudinibacter sp. P27/CKL/0425]